jgi:hypothetical protein
MSPALKLSSHSQGYHLTDKLAKELPTPACGSSKIYYDDEVKGFGVRVTGANARAFVLNYRNRAGRERRYTIGRVSEWKVGVARAEANGSSKKYE